MGQRFVSCMLILSAATLWPSGAHGQSSDLVGTWEGSIRGPGPVQAVSVTIRIDDEGAFTGTADIPGQGAQLRPLINIEVRDQYVSFQGRRGSRQSPLRRRGFRGRQNLLREISPRPARPFPFRSPSGRKRRKVRRATPPGWRECGTEHSTPAH